MFTKLKEDEGAGDVLLGICACTNIERNDLESKMSQQYEQAFDTVTNADEKDGDNNLSNLDADSNLDTDSKRLYFVA